MVIFVDNQFMSKHTFHTQNTSFSTPGLIGLHYTGSYVKWVDMSQYNKLFDFQYARFHIDQSPYWCVAHRSKIVSSEANCCS